MAPKGRLMKSQNSQPGDIERHPRTGQTNSCGKHVNRSACLGAETEIEKAPQDPFFIQVCVDTIISTKSFPGLSIMLENRDHALEHSCCSINPFYLYHPLSGEHLDSSQQSFAHLTLLHSTPHLFFFSLNNHDCFGLPKSAWFLAPIFVSLLSTYCNLPSLFSVESKDITRFRTFHFPK